ALPVYGERIVRGRTAKLVAHWAVADIFKCTAVDKHGPVLIADPDAERVGVAVTTAARPNRTCIEDDLAGVFIHDVKAGISEGDGLPLQWLLRKAVEFTGCTGPKQPECLFAYFLRDTFEVTAAIKNRPGRERVEHVFRAVTLPI